MTNLRRTLLAAAVPALGWLVPGRLAAQAAPQVPVVTLDEARRRAAQVDPTLVAARSNTGTATWERRAARADLITPHITAATNFTKYSDPFFSFTGQPSTTVATANLSATYSILGVGKLAELRRSNASLATAEATETAVGYNTNLATDEAYYTVLAETELSRVAADRLRRAQDQLAIARSRVQAGETISTDSLQLLLEVNRAQFGVIQRDSGLAVARLRLGRQIGLPGPADAAPIDSAPPPELPITLDEAVNELRTQGPELQAIRAAERQADAVVSAQRAQYLPTVTLGAAWASYDSDFFPTFLQRSSLAVGLSWPLWDSGQRELEFARARNQRDAVRATRVDRERGAADDMAQVYNGYQTARAGVQLASVGREVAAETYRVQGARYREGATTILDLLEAQVNLSEAEAALIQARHQARLSLAQIEARLGRRLFPTGH